MFPKSFNALTLAVAVSAAGVAAKQEEKRGLSLYPSLFTPYPLADYSLACLTDIFDTITSGAGSVFTDITSGAGSVFTDVTSGAGSVFTDVTSGAGGAYTTVTSNVDGALTTITSAVGGAYSTATSGGAGAFSTATGGAGSVFNSLTSAGGCKLISGLTVWAMLTRLATVQPSSTAPQVPRMPLLALNLLAFRCPCLQVLRPLLWVWAPAHGSRFESDIV